jgi:hypothetical protein
LSSLDLYITSPLAELDAWLAPYRRMWEASLDALERRLNTTEEE